MCVRSVCAAFVSALCVSAASGGVSASIQAPGGTTSGFVETAVNGWNEPVAASMSTSSRPASMLIPSPGSAVLFTMAIGVALTRKRTRGVVAPDTTTADAAISAEPHVSVATTAAA